VAERENVSGARDRPAKAVSQCGDTGGAAVSLQAVSKSYGSTLAVRHVSLNIGAGHFAAILGPSGSGKTTLLGLVAGFMVPDHGTILIGGRDVRDSPPYERDLGVVFQHYALFPHMSVRENVAFPLEMRRWTKSAIATRVGEALDLVQLRGLEERRPSQLSGGQQQRVALARALVYRPPILLLDEPLGALDRRLRDSMQAELKALHRSLGITFIYVTHDQEEALSLADTVIIMRDGEIEQQGSPESIYDMPRTRFVASFVGDCNVWTGTVQPLVKGFEIRHPETGLVLHRSERVDPPPADAVPVGIRPEWFVVTRGREPRMERGEGMSARVVQERFRGSETLLECQTPLGPALVRIPRGVVGSGLPLREEVFLSWSPEQTALLEAGHGGGPPVLGIHR
jgi:ABC-type Fe3+/spermidine/putrescine transport system ATPase subunit